MRAPRYGEASLTEVLPSVAAALGAPGFTNALALPSLTQAVVVVIDGLGHRQLLAAHEDAPCLGPAAWEQGPIDAAFPTTTPAGLASLTLGMPPARHGLVGATFELPDFDIVLNPLRWDSTPPPEAVQPERNLFSRMAGLQVRSHGPAAFAATGMTRTLLHAALQCPYETFDASTIDAHAGRLDYVYLPQLDKVGHGDGPHTAQWRAALRRIDAVVQAIARRLPSSAGIVVTSDHGMVTVPDDRRIDADDAMLQAGVRRMAGEPRMRQLYTDDADSVRQRWRARLGEAGTVLLRDEALALGLFGELDEFVTDRIGDVIAIAHDDWAFTSTVVDPKPSGLRGMHGALTDEELLVPALILRGEA